MTLDLNSELLKNALTVPEAIIQRRSIRRYTDEPIPDEALRTIIELAGRSPSSDNVQPWRLIVVRNKEMLQRLQSAAMDQQQVGRSAVTFVVYSDMQDALRSVDEFIHPNIQGSDREMRRQKILDYFGKMSIDEQEIWGVGQTYIFLGYLELAIQALGYASSSMLGFYPSKVKELFSLPKQVRIAALVACGKAAEEGFPTHRHPIDRFTRFID
jgi:nitroreductase